MVALLKDLHRRLSIEVLPPRPPAVPASAARRPAWVTGAAALAAIAGLHALVIGWVLYGPGPRAERREPAPLVLLAPQVTAEGAPRFPRPRAPAIAALATIPEWPPRPAPAVPILAAPVNAAVDAAPATSAQIVRVCGAVLRQQSRNHGASSTRSLLLLVEADGRVTDSRGEDEREAAIDDSSRDCILAHVILAPTRIDGAPVASWQRVVWSVPEAVRGR